MNDNILIRAYREQDKAAVVHLFRLNTPTYFSADEERDLLFFLENEIEYYYVVEIDLLIVGCGGLNFSGDETISKISWDIFHPDYQGKSLGSKLMSYRLQKLKEFHGIEAIIVRTTQLVYQFYEKQGFELVEVVEDY